jgi:tetratricopeptide (TPR) repeat protein
MSLKRAEKDASLSAADQARLGESLLWQAELMASMPKVDPSRPVQLREEARSRFEQALKKDPDNNDAKSGLLVLDDVTGGAMGGHNHGTEDAGFSTEMPTPPMEFGEDLAGRIAEGNWWFDEAAARYEHLHGEGTPEQRKLIVDMFTNSIEAYEAALEMDPDNPNVLTDCGIMYFYRSQLAQDETVMESVMGALQKYNAALELDPDFPPALYNMVKMYATIGDTDKMRDFCQRYLAATEDMKSDPNVQAMRSEVDRVLEMLKSQ